MVKKSSKDQPHIVKFSGGRSSAMMLLKLLEDGALKAKRGDVVVFNNTSAEHPATYVFTAKIKHLVEQTWNIPFFWIEYQTCEDVSRSGWVRKPTYRLVNEYPWSEQNPQGYRWRGEVFEEMISQDGFLPNMQTRICTQNLKIRTTNEFLADWFAHKDGIERLGHTGTQARMTDEEVIERHRSHGGGVPKEILLTKKTFSRGCAYVRESSKWRDFTNSRLCMNNETVKSSVLGGKGQLFGSSPIKYVSYLGIRKDEEARAEKIRARIAHSQNKGNRSYSDQPPGESIEVPLVEWGITKPEVIAYLKEQPFDLELPETGIFSNCVYCPLKGKKKLMQIAQSEVAGHLPDGTPASIDWWIAMEKKYRRDLKAERRKIKSGKDAGYISFFGASSSCVYADIKNQAMDIQADYLEDDSYIPCNCTD